MTALTAAVVESQQALVGASADVERLLELARRHVGMELAWMSEFHGGQQMIRAVSGEAAAMSVTLEEGTPLEGSFCVRVLTGALPSAITDARRHPVARELTVTRDLGIGSYVGAP